MKDREPVDQRPRGARCERLGEGRAGDAADNWECSGPVFQEREGRALATSTARDVTARWQSDRLAYPTDDELPAEAMAETIKRICVARQESVLT